MSTRCARVDRFGIALLPVIALLGLTPQAVRADTLVREWNDVKIPPIPALKDASLDPKTTALFMISMTRDNCEPKRRPRCTATLPGIAKLLQKARDGNVLVVHSLTRGGSAQDQLVPELAPRDGETVLAAGLGPDKFIGSNLDELLKGRGIKTLIVVGTQAQTAVLHTGAGAAFRDYRVIVPIDGMSSDDAFPELYTAWHLATTLRIKEFTTLTELERVSFAAP